jgi:membrane protease YdiL (CAAX protease family)
MIIPDNWLSRIFIKKEYLPMHVELSFDNLRYTTKRFGSSSLDFLKRWINWILIIFIAVTTFVIVPINPLEKILYSISFIMLGFITYLLREELGFIGVNLSKLVKFINTKQGMFMLIPLVIFTVSEMLLINSVENVILFYSFCCVVFLIFATFSDEKYTRNYWAMLILPVVLRMVNLSLPFPIINSKIQLFLTYGLITYSSFLMAKHLGVKMPYLKGASWKQYIIAVFLGLGLGTLEYHILGFIPIITVLSEFDYIYLIFIIFIIGFGEELVYRGLVQTTQDEVIGRKGALFLSSVLFGIMHLIWRNPLEFFFTTFAGFVFGYQFYKTDSIIPPTIAHIMNNTTWLIFAPGWGL